MIDRHPLRQDRQVPLDLLQPPGRVEAGRVVDADIAALPVARQRAMGMAVEMQRATMRLVPDAQPVMQQHDLSAVERQLGIRLARRPGVELPQLLGIVVAPDEMLAAVQPLQIGVGRFLAAEGEIAEVPDLVLDRKSVV